MQCHVDDLQFAAAQLSGWRNRPKVLAALSLGLPQDEPEEGRKPKQSDPDNPTQPTADTTTQGKGENKRTKSRRRKAGRPQRTEHDPQVKKENQLYRDWKASALQLSEFLRARGINEKEGRQQIDRARKRVEKPRN